MSLSHHSSWSSDTEMDYDFDVDQAESELGSTVSEVRQELQKLAIQSPQPDESDVVDADLLASPPREPVRAWLKRTRDQVAFTKGKSIVWHEPEDDGRSGGKKRARMSSVDLVDADGVSEEDEAEETVLRHKLPQFRTPIKCAEPLQTLTKHSLGSPYESDDSSDDDDEITALLVALPETPCPRGPAACWRKLVSKTGKNRPTRHVASGQTGSSSRQPAYIDRPSLLPSLRGYDGQMSSFAYIKALKHADVVATLPLMGPEYGMQNTDIQKMVAKHRFAFKTAPHRVPSQYTKQLHRRSPISLLPKRPTRLTQPFHPITGADNLNLLRTKREIRINRCMIINGAQTTQRNLARLMCAREGIPEVKRYSTVAKTGNTIRRELYDERIKMCFRVKAVKRSAGRRKGEGWVLPAWARMPGDRWWLASPEVIPVEEEVEDELDSDIESDDGSDISDDLESDAEEALSPPPIYSPPISRPRARSPSRLPAYHTNNYSTRSPSPPPPYNAHTDREPVSLPVETLLSRIAPVDSNLRIYSSSTVIPPPRSSTPVVHSSIAWDLAAEVEEADEFNADETIRRFEDAEAERTRVEAEEERAGTWGTITSWLGGFLRR